MAGRFNQGQYSQLSTVPPSTGPNTAKRGNSQNNKRSHPDKAHQGLHHLLHNVFVPSKSLLNWQGAIYGITSIIIVALLFMMGVWSIMHLKASVKLHKEYLAPKDGNYDWTSNTNYKIMYEAVTRVYQEENGVVDAVAQQATRNYFTKVSWIEKRHLVWAVPAFLFLAGIFHTALVVMAAVPLLERVNAKSFYENQQKRFEYMQATGSLCLAAAFLSYAVCSSAFNSPFSHIKEGTMKSYIGDAERVMGDKLEPGIDSMHTKFLFKSDLYSGMAILELILVIVFAVKLLVVNGMSIMAKDLHFLKGLRQIIFDPFRTGERSDEKAETARREHPVKEDATDIETHEMHPMRTAH